MVSRVASEGTNESEILLFLAPPLLLLHPLLFLRFDSSIELNEERSGAVSPLGVVRHLRPAHRAGPLPVEPRYLKNSIFISANEITGRQICATS